MDILRASRSLPSTTSRGTTVWARADHRGRWLTLLLAVALIAALTGPLPAQAAAPHAPQERQFLELMNTARDSRGLSPLAASSGAADVARRWSKRMASDGNLRHNPDVSDQLPMAWQRWGENVGYASNRGGGSLSAVIKRLHQGFMDSDGHRANILGRFNQVGVGVAIDGDDTVWATMVFVQGSQPTRTPEPEPAPNGLTDIAGSGHRATITTAVERGLIEPCDTRRRRFCPSDRATRSTAASTVARALELAPGKRSHFSDVAAPSYVDALADAGIVRGCTSRRFCPNRKVTRAQFASLLVRALPQLTPVASRRFSDLAAGNVHAEAVNALAASGITRGCGPTRFCPEGKVTRAQLASFVVRAFDL